MASPGHLNSEFLRMATTPEIAMELLRSLVQRSEEGVSAWNTINAVRSSEHDRTALQGRLSDAWAWLTAQGFVGPSTSQATGGFCRVTAAGVDAASSDYGAEHAWAEHRLAGGLLDGLSSARANFERGDYDTSVFAAFKAVEVRVRELGEFGNDLVGKNLMERAFGSGGPLTDPAAEKGEQVALQLLFSGAIGTFRNPGSHRTVEFDDPIEAAEALQFADLLLRVLARTEARLAAIASTRAGMGP